MVSYGWIVVEVVAPVLYSVFYLKLILQNIFDAVNNLGLSSWTLF